MTRHEIFQQIFETERGIFELEHRASGRTTRLIDKYVQELFNNPNEWVNVYDHWPERRAAAMLVDKIRQRLDYEHHLEAEVKGIEGGFAMRLKNYQRPDFSEEIKRQEEQLFELRKLVAHEFR